MTASRSDDAPGSRKPSRGAPVEAATTAISSMTLRRLEAFLEMLAAERGAARLTLSAYRADLEDLASSSPHAE